MENEKYIIMEYRIGNKVQYLNLTCNNCLTTFIIKNYGPLRSVKGLIVEYNEHLRKCEAIRKATFD